MSHSRNSFSLSGPSRALDPRVNAMRGDLADVALAGRHFSPHYANPVERFCSVPFAAIRDRPEGQQISELLVGEVFMLLDISGGWAWGYTGQDHYVGYVLADALAASGGQAAVPATADAVDAAKQFLGQPYVWGGRGGCGIDCSGLIQRSLAAMGVMAPRDSDMQMDTVGVAIPEGALLRRGDLIFFPGHVGMMVDAENMIHATRHHGKTVIEPLGDVVIRVAEEHEKPVLARKRISQ